MLVPTLAQSVISCVQLLCERLAFIEPPEVTEAVFNLRRACKAITQFDFETSVVSMEVSAAMSLQRRWHVSYSLRGRRWVNGYKWTVGLEIVRTQWLAVVLDICGPTVQCLFPWQDILSALDVLQRGVWLLVSMYCASFLPGFRPHWAPERTGSLSMDSTLRVKVSALHRVPHTEFRRSSAVYLWLCSVVNVTFVLVAMTCSKWRSVSTMAGNCYQSGCILPQQRQQEVSFPQLFGTSGK